MAGRSCRETAGAMAVASLHTHSAELRKNQILTQITSPENPIFRYFQAASCLPMANP